MGRGNEKQQGSEYWPGGHESLKGSRGWGWHVWQACSLSVCLRVPDYVCVCVMVSVGQKSGTDGASQGILCVKICVYGLKHFVGLRVHVYVCS